MEVDYTPQLPQSWEIVASFEERPSDTMIPNQPVRVPVMVHAIDLGTLEMNTMVKDLGPVTMDFFVLTMYEVHTIQNYIVT